MSTYGFQSILTSSISLDLLNNARGRKGNYYPHFMIEKNLCKTKASGSEACLRLSERRHLVVDRIGLSGGAASWGHSSKDRTGALVERGDSQQRK